MGHRQHHYVPCFLLEQWHSLPDDKLSAFRWARDKLVHSRLKAKSVAKAEHLYSMQRSLPAPDVKIEREFLGPRVDGPAAEVHRKILANGVRSLKGEDREAWSRFLVSLLLRAPRMIAHVRQHGRAILLKGMAESVSDTPGPDEEPALTLPEWAEAHESDLLDDLGVMTLPSLVFSQRLNGALLAARWATRTVRDSRVDLLISDKPLIVHGSFDSAFAIGLPIAPDRVFVAFNRGRTWATISAKGDEMLAREMNRRAVLDADSYVYASSPAQERLIKKYLRRESGRPGAI